MSPACVPHKVGYGDRYSSVPVPLISLDAHSTSAYKRHSTQQYCFALHSPHSWRGYERRVKKIARLDHGNNIVHHHHVHGVIVEKGDAEGE
jgi:hypothetical protein